MVDLVLKGGDIIDGTGSSSIAGNIVINNGSIISIDNDIELEANLELDVTGKVVCPGFIDIHSHADFSLMADRRNEGAIRQGITTLVTGNCGHGPAPVNDVDLTKRNTVPGILLKNI